MTDDKKPGAKSAHRRRRGGKSTAGKPGPTRQAEHGVAEGTEVASSGTTAARRTMPPNADRIPPPPSAADTTPAPSSEHVLATIPLHVRWRDLDAFNHVNNSSYLTFLEEARLQWLRNVPGEWFGEHAMPVMAAVELHYRKPITWPGEVDVLLSCGRLGNSSLTIGNRIVDRNDSSCVYADGDIVMVWIDPATGASVPLPEAIRQACSA